MQISVFPASLRVTSREKALEFYGCIKHCVLIPYSEDMVIRVEPNRLIGFVSKEDLQKGVAMFVPNLSDEDGKIAYENRKYINAWLKGDR